MTLDNQLITLIQNKHEFTEVFSILAKTHLKNAYLCAGALRDYVWCTQEKLDFHLITRNLDIYYCDPNESYEEYLTRKTELNQRHSKYLWELTNISLKNQKFPATTELDTVLKNFPETCSAVGVTYTENGFEVIAPYGLEDLFSETIRPTATYLKKNSLATFKQRVTRKKWLTHYSNTTLILPK